VKIGAPERVQTARRLPGRCYSRSVADANRTQGEPDVVVRHEGGNIRHWILGIAVLLLAIIALQNSQSVKMDFLFVDTEAPLIVALLIAGVLGAIIGYVGPVVRHHRREQRKQERSKD